MSVRERVALLCTPWEWRSRRAVVGLVAVSVAELFLVIVYSLARQAPGPAKVINLVLAVLAASLGTTWPAIRSLRRWDASHTRLP